VQLRCKKCDEELYNPVYLEKNYLTECPNCHTWLYFNSQKQDIEIIDEIRPKEHPLAFFSHSFRDADREINDFFMNLLTFHFISVDTIERDTRSVDKTQKASEGIKKSDFVFIVMPKRWQCYDEESRLVGKSSEWIQNEIGMAYAFKKDIFAVIEEGVKDEGMLKDIRWCYSFNRDRLTPVWIEANNKRTPGETKNELLLTLESIFQ